MTTRRRYLAGCSVALAGLLSGCVGSLPLVGDNEPARIGLELRNRNDTEKRVTVRVSEQSPTQVVYEDTFDVPADDVVLKDEVMPANETESPYLVSIKVEGEDWHKEEWSGTGCGLRVEFGQHVLITSICHDD